MSRTFIVVLSDAWRNAPLTDWDDSGEMPLHPADHNALRLACEEAEKSDTAGASPAIIATAVGGDNVRPMLEAALALGAHRAVQVLPSAAPETEGANVRLTPRQTAACLLAALKDDAAQADCIYLGQRQADEYAELSAALDYALDTMQPQNSTRPRIKSVPARGVFDGTKRRIPHCADIEAVFAGDGRIEQRETSCIAAKNLLHSNGFLPLPQQNCRFIDGKAEEQALALAHALLVRAETQGREIRVPFEQADTPQTIPQARIWLLAHTGAHESPAFAALSGYAQAFARSAENFANLIVETLSGDEAAQRLAAAANSPHTAAAQADAPQIILAPASHLGSQAIHALEARHDMALLHGAQALRIEASTGRVEALRLKAGKLERFTTQHGPLLATFIPPADPAFAPAATLAEDEKKKIYHPKFSTNTITVATGRSCPQELAPQVTTLAELLNGDWIATRAAVDMGLAPRGRLRVYTAFQETSALYLGIGVSGVSPHLDAAGPALSRMAINRDASAPVFEQADYGIIGMIEAVLPLLVHSLQRLTGTAQSL